MAPPLGNPARQSAGGAAGAHGVTFEAGAAAWWIAQTLCGNTVAGRQFGIEENAAPVRVGGQTGMAVDDLGVEFSNEQRLFGQCKSRVRVSSKWPSSHNEFASAWIQFYEQLRRCSPDERAAFVLCYEHETESLRSLRIILGRYRDYGCELKLTDCRIAVTADEQRVATTLLDLFASLSAEDELREIETDQSRLVSSTYLHHLQMAVGEPNHLQIAQQLQVSVLADSEQVGHAMLILCDLGTKVHKDRTSVGRVQILTELRLAKIELRDLPDHRADWSTLEQASAHVRNTVFTTIGSTLHLKRLTEINRVRGALQSSHSVVVLGPSGCGKSGVVKALIDELDANENRLLWFAAADLDAFSKSDLREALGLKFSLNELFASTTRLNGYVVIDGIDRCFSEKGLQRLRQVVEACALEQPTTVWRVIFTCQDSEWAHVLPRLLRARVPLAPDAKSGAVDTLTSDDLAEIADRIPALSHIVSQHHLRDLLTKPKVLDLVAHHVERGGHFDPSSFVGESHLVDWWWQAEVQVGPHAIARAAALCELAARQAAEMRVAIALTDLSASMRTMADELVQSRLLVLRGNRLNFAHDLYGDWTRLQVLLGHQAELAAFVMPQIRSPLWHKSLRLYALRQLERHPTVDAWERDFATFTGNTSEAQLASDLFLEAILFAPNSKALLERLWPIFSRDKGALLTRFVRRFEYAATTPDEFFLERARADGGEQIIETAAAIRRPLIERWPPVIEFLNAHCQEMAGLLPGELARMAFSWFGWTEAGAPARAEMAALIVSAAEHCCRHEIHDSRARSENTVEQVYRSALRAFAEEPYRVRELALRLSGRKENDWVVKEQPRPLRPLPEALRNDPAFEELANIGSTVPLGGPIENWHVVGPWPDGPQFSVSGEFREAFLRGDAHRAMIDEDPALASEVLLSLLIEHSHRVSPFEAFSSRLDENRGLQSDHSTEAPFYNTGPYLYFLRRHPEAAFDCFVKLINFASERWAEQFERRENEVWKTTVEVAGEERVLFGDWRLYYAYRNAAWIHPAIQSATMALEKWLHDKLTAGSLVQSDLDRILDRSRSVAFAGVLIAIGKRRNDLLWTTLWPLTCTPQLHLWEDGHNGQFVPGTGGGWNEPPQLRERRSRWNNLSFRFESLPDLCCRLFLDDPQGREQLGRLKHVWLTRADSLREESPLRPTLVRLAECFDVTNWSRDRDEDGEETWVFNPQACTSDAAIPSGSEAPSEPQFLNLTPLPFACYQALRGGESDIARDPERLWELFEIVVGIARDGSGEAHGLRDPQDGVAGVAALLLKFHREWLRTDPPRERLCFDTFVAVPHRALHSLPEFGGVGEGETMWALCCAELLPTIWQEDRACSSVRAAIAAVVIHGSDEAVASLLRSLFVTGRHLSVEFEQIQTLVVYNAVARNRHQWFRALNDDPARYPNWIDDEIADFAAGYSRAYPSDWLEIRHVQFRMPYGHSFRFERRTERQNYGMDFDRVVAAFGWIPSLDRAVSGAERAAWIHKYREIVRCLLGTFPSLSDTSEEYEGLPYEVDRRVLAKSAELALQLNDDEDHTAFWQPILALGPAAHPWVSEFIHRFLMSALEAQSPLPHFARRWVAMLDFAEASSEWCARGRKPWERERLWLALLGIDPVLHSCWQPQHRKVLADIWPNIERWARQYLRGEESLGPFLRLMKLPIASRWIPESMLLIDQAAASGSVDDDDDDELPEDQLARFLVFVHERHHAAVRSTAAVHGAFVRLVTKLAAMQNRTALELQSRLTAGN